MPQNKPQKKVVKANQITELPFDALCKLCNPENLSFNSTDDLPDLQAVIGQPRAFRALELGSEVSGPGYNTFVLGQPGSGRTTLTYEYLQRKAAGEPTPDDWCYVNNFDNPHQPIVLSLPAGRGTELRKDLQELVERCERDLPRLYESEEFTHERDQIVGELKKSQEAEFIRLQKYVEKFSFVIERTPYGFLLAPAVQGKRLTQEDLERLNPEQRLKLEQLQLRLGEEVEKSLVKIRELERGANQQINQLNERTILFLVGPLIQALKEKYATLEQVVAHLDRVQSDMIANSGQFRPAQAESGGISIAQLFEIPPSRRYSVNVLVDNSGLKGAPVILESHPSYVSLLGRIEHEAMMGATRTDFTMIQPGCLHRANGGYLVMPVRDLLLNGYTWEGLKRVLRDGEIKIIELGQIMGLLSAVTLEPQPIPLNLKVVLVGTPLLYYLIRTYEEDFAKLFKVRAEFATEMERTPQTENEYGLFVKSVVMDNQLPRFGRSAVARIVEHSARMAEDQDKLSTRFGRIADLVREAAYWAKERQAKSGKRKVLVTSRDVQQAIDEMIYRNNLIEERLQEMIADNTLKIDVNGKVVGQINALSVYLLGDYMFGRPNRLTAAAYPGTGGVIDIERQAKLGGPIHTKGVLILSGFLGNRYGRSRPLSLAASLTFEQSYDSIEGDSASAAELLVMLSAIAQIPLRQDRAITGSINQHGEVQAIGGVNEKIEGFYAVCKARRLTGEQGVIIPASNQRNLMLKEEVVQAVKRGKFHVWSVKRIDEAIYLMTGLEPGELQSNGSYPEGTFNDKVMKRLAELARSAEAARKEASQKPVSNENESAGG